MDESNVRPILEVFVAVVITGLGGKELFARWQEHANKRSEKLLDHELSNDDRAINYIIAQSEQYRLQVEDLQNNKFVQMRDDLAEINKKLTPCQGLLQELLENRKGSQERDEQLLLVESKQNEILNSMVDKLRLNAKKIDTTGQISDLTDAMLNIPERMDKIRTGEWAVHPPPPDESQ